MSTSDSTFSRACLALAAMPEPRRAALLAAMPSETRQSVQEDLARFAMVSAEQRLQFLAAAQPGSVPTEPLPVQPSPAGLPVLPPEGLLRLLEHEHPVLLALLLERLDPRDASRIFTLLSPGLREEVARHIASHYRPRPWVAERLDAWLSQAADEAPDLRVPGRLSRILSRCPGHVAEDVLDRLGVETLPEPQPTSRRPLLRLARPVAVTESGSEEGVA